MGIEERIKQKALSLGFDIVGITSADDIDKQQIAKFKEWLASGSNGGMDFLARNPEKRFSPTNILPEAKSIICIAINYKINTRDCFVAPEKGAPRNDRVFGNNELKDQLKIASYALYPDYHIFIKDKLSALAEFLKTFDANLKYKICVDSSPIAEKALAMRAGLGFIGKNRLVINQKFGSFLLLGELITNLKLQADRPIEKQQCGNCRKCIDACPTGALSENGFDARKCISYLTIEHKGEIDFDLKSKISKHLFGCDECLMACPYNVKSPVCEKAQYGFEARGIKLQAEDVISWTQKEFEEFALSSVMRRTGLDRFKRNAIACKNETGRRPL
jgi:epoxyqueuosine reductase